MVKITCIIKPYRLEQVKSAIAALDVTGMNVSDVRGCGNSPEKANWLAGEEFLIALPLRSKIEVVVSADRSEEVIRTILKFAQTGEDGDGKIFVEPVENVIRIRTNERGTPAL